MELKQEASSIPSGPEGSPTAPCPPPIPFRRRLHRKLARHLPIVIWMFGALLAGWLYFREPARVQAIATAEFSEVRVLSEASGHVLQIPVKEGQLVKQGDVLAVLDSRDVEDRITRCQAILHRLQSITKVERRGSALEEFAGQDELNLYELKLADLFRERQKCTIIARFAGRIESVIMKAGDWVAPGAEMFLMDIGRPGRLTAFLTDLRTPLLRGTRTLLHPRGGRGISYSGRVVKVNSRLEQTPLRVHREVPNFTSWTRTATIELDQLAELVPEEVYEVHFIH